MTWVGHPHSPLATDRYYGEFYQSFHACLGASRMYEALWLYEHKIIDAMKCAELLLKPARDEAHAVELIQSITRLEEKRRNEEKK